MDNYIVANRSENTLIKLAPEPFNSPEEKEEEMIYMILEKLFKKMVVKLHYKDGKVNEIIRYSGEFWLNDYPKPFLSFDVFETWLVKEIPHIIKIESAYY